jgi:nucleotide-binding universal stress UspA family protein
MATKTTTPGTSFAAHREHVCSRVLVGIDRSAESVEAARQAAILTEPGGSLTLLAAWTLPPPVIGVVSPEFAYHADEDLEIEAATDALTAAKDELASSVSPTTKIVRGFAWDELIKEIRNEDATLVVVGSHGSGRMRGILIGSTATAIVHKAPCSVLVARSAAPEFPTRIVVGVDGSPQSADAYAAAAHLAARFGAELWPIVAHGGKGVDKQLVATIVDHHHEDLPDDPVTALVAASADADLLVVGSRGLHGPKALGSVSERAAHRAQCSTLIVREPPSQGEAAS